MQAWMQWIANNWEALCAGRKLCVRQGWLAHPRFVPGFRQVQGWPMGQSCDWGLQLDDKSRIHAQCYAAPDGTPMLCIHRDKWDPDRGLGHAVMHALFETPAGPAFGVAALATVAVSAANGGRARRPLAVRRRARRLSRNPRARRSRPRARS